MSIRMTQEIRDYRSLLLDDQNPRLPEELRGKSQAELMRAFYQYYGLDELASSYVQNGFFDAEALIILDNGTVIEGNRRLAALKYLLHDKDAATAELPQYPLDAFDAPFNGRELENVPVFVANTRDELMAYLGFHHINGPMQWPPASKARYVYERVEKASDEQKDANPFYAVSKEIGSNTQGVRNVYRQYGLLRVARDQLGLQKEATYVINERFGVWARLTSSTAVFDHIGFQPAETSYEAIRSALNNLDSFDRVRFKALLEDLIPPEGGQAVLNDSRKATAYARIITDENALKLLRQTHDYEVAIFIADKGLINDKLIDVKRRLDSVGDDLENGAAADRDTSKLVTALRSKIEGISAQVEFYLKNNPREKTDNDQ